MFVYVVIAAIVGIALGLLFAIRTKKEQGITYGKLDRVGKITNRANVSVPQFFKYTSHKRTSL